LWSAQLDAAMDADDTALLEGAIWFDGTNTQDQALALFAGGGGCTKSTPKTDCVPVQATWFGAGGAQSIFSPC
jgi:hypothetical protein